MAWLLGDLPGHPVAPCAYEDWKDAPPVQRSLIHFFSQPGRAEQELRLEADFWANLGIPRLNARFWQLYDEELARSIEEIVGQGRVRPLEANPAA